MNVPILSVRDLSVAFAVGGGFGRAPLQLRAVDRVSFDLAPGETLGVVGESGCGKSTLGRAVLRLIEPSGGRVVWRGRDLADLSARELRSARKEMQIVFQDPLASLDPRMTVGDIVGEPLTTFERGLSRKERQARAVYALERVGLSGQHINRYPHEFSGGQCQRIGIARALVLRPRLIVCDEPVSALDVSIQSQILNLLLDLQRSEGISYIFISHNLGVVRHLSHRIAVLYLGRIVEEGAAEEIFRAPRHPYTQALIAAMPIADPDRERSRPKLLLRGEIPSPLDPPSGCVFRTRCRHADAICGSERPAMLGDSHRVACHHWQRLGES
jgi:oligopeptide transport system ATP-binding protein